MLQNIPHKKESPETCLHESFHTQAKIFRLADDDNKNVITGYSADIRIHCSVCGQSFEFIGVSMGYAPSHPTVNADCTELRAPIRPSRQPALKDETKIVN